MTDVPFVDLIFGAMIKNEDRFVEIVDELVPLDFNNIDSDDEDCRIMDTREESRKSSISMGAEIAETKYKLKRFELSDEWVVGAIILKGTTMDEFTTLINANKPTKEEETQFCDWLKKKCPDLEYNQFMIRSTQLY